MALHKSVQTHASLRPQNTIRTFSQKKNKTHTNFNENEIITTTMNHVKNAASEHTLSLSTVSVVWRAKLHTMPIDQKKKRLLSRKQRVTNEIALNACTFVRLTAPTELLYDE